MDLDELINVLTELRDQRGRTMPVVVRFGYLKTSVYSVWDEGFVHPDNPGPPTIVLTVTDIPIG